MGSIIVMIMIYTFIHAKAEELDPYHFMYHFWKRFSWPTCLKALQAKIGGAALLRVAGGRELS